MARFAPGFSAHRLIDLTSAESLPVWPPCLHSTSPDRLSSQGLFNPALCGGAAPHEFLIRSRWDSYSLQVSRVVQPGDGPFSPAIHAQLSDATAIKGIGHSGEIGLLEPEPPVHHGHHGMTMRHDQHRIALDPSHHPLHPRHNSACHHPPAFS